VSQGVVWCPGCVVPGVCGVVWCVRHPELKHAPDTEETLQRLINAAQQVWHTIDQAILDRLASTMPNRVIAVIKAEGWYTKY